MPPDPFTPDEPEPDGGLRPPKRFSAGCLLALVVSSVGLIIIGILVCQVLGSILNDVAPPQP
jgi:hypothetical protein